MDSVYSNNKSNCCGCGACVVICPSDAIRLCPDKQGFPFPVIDQSKCINCGICVSKCAFQNSIDYKTDKSEIYAVKHKSDDIREQSTSGGIFTAVSDYVVERDGVVFGCELDKDLNVVHSCALTKNGRDKFRGSKYVKSDLKNTFIQVKEYLSEGRIVLFTGTPCECAGLKSFIGKDDNLILMDFVCHGTPSQLMFREYIRFIEKKTKKKVADHKFRTKVRGWRGHTEMNIYTDGKRDYKSILSQLYRDLFYSDINLNLNLSCYNCRYTNFNRPSDLTMGDFWGIEKCLPDFDDNKGVSLFLVNTQRGRDIFDSIKNGLEYYKSNKVDVAKKQAHLSRPNKPSANRELFWQDYFNFGFEYVVNKYTNFSGFRRVKYEFKRLMRYILLKTRTYTYIRKIIKRH